MSEWKSVKKDGWPDKNKGCSAHVWATPSQDFVKSIVHPATYQDRYFYDAGGYRIPSNRITHYILYPRPEPPKPEILPCPWPECRSGEVVMERTVSLPVQYWINCLTCNANSPTAPTEAEAIRIHNSMPQPERK